MAKIGVVGNSEFILGFQLAGIQGTFEVDEDPTPIIKEIIQNKDISIVILDERLMKNMYDKSIVDESVDPVFITLSTEATQEGLKNMIKKSIGIDLWKGE